MASHNSNQKCLRNAFRCSECTRGYMSKESRDIHQRLHKQRTKAMEKNPQSYTGT